MDERLVELPIKESASGCYIWASPAKTRAHKTILDPVRKGRQIGVHRFVYELVHGPIPEGFQVHHTCGQMNCVNPTHLQAVSASEHVRLHLGISEEEWAKRAPGGNRRGEALGAPPSPRQKEILHLIGTGMTTIEIAEHLELQPRTVKMHVDKLRSKLGVSHKRQLIPLAREWEDKH